MNKKYYSNSCDIENWWKNRVQTPLGNPETETEEEQNLMQHIHILFPKQLCIEEGQKDHIHVQHFWRKWIGNTKEEEEEEEMRKQSQS